MLFVLLLLALNLVADAGGQLSFKVAATEDDEETGLLKHWLHMFSRPWIWIGIGCYVMELVVYIGLVANIELSVAVMLVSFDIVVLMLIGRWLFDEKLTKWRLAGMSLVTLGCVVVGFGS